MMEVEVIGLSVVAYSVSNVEVKPIFAFVGACSGDVGSDNLIIGLHWVGTFLLLLIATSEECHEECCCPYR